MNIIYTKKAAACITGARLTKIISVEILGDRCYINLIGQPAAIVEPSRFLQHFYAIRKKAAQGLFVLGRQGAIAFVPSSKGDELYKVNLEKKTCTCTDFQNQLLCDEIVEPKCKHLFAAEGSQHSNQDLADALSVFSV